MKSTHLYAHHDLDLYCDVYDSESVTTPVLLYFHPGSLTGGVRELIPPWLVQACIARHWPLISASYRFLPQVSAQGLVDDALAAYRFAQTWKGRRSVILGGGSAGFFMANLITHHALNQTTIAMLSYSGVPTFQHAFFRSSVSLTPEPITYTDVAHWIEGPLVAGDLPDGETAFSLDMLERPKSSPIRPETVKLSRWDMYDYYLYTNAYPQMLADIDPGSKGVDNIIILPNVFIQGELDTALPMSVINDAASHPNSKVFIAKGQDHLFDSQSFLQTETESMKCIRDALACLDQHVNAAISGQAQASH